MEVFKQEKVDLNDSALGLETRSLKALKITGMVLFFLVILGLNVLSILFSSCRREPWQWRSYGMW